MNYMSFDCPFFFLDQNYYINLNVKIKNKKHKITQKDPREHNIGVYF